MLDTVLTERNHAVVSHSVSRSSRIRWTTFAVLVALYTTLTIAVVVGSPLDAVDRSAASMHLALHWPDVTPWILRYVVIAQRAPSAIVAGSYVIWRAWRARSARPVVTLLTAILLLNLSVGAVKVATGRLGPLLTTHPRAVFDGGDIFPSGHTSNAVVIFGVLAMLACRHRRLASGLAIFGATTVGVSTIFLDTHWVTDVLGGWLAGGLILLALPEATEYAHRGIVLARRRWRRRGTTLRRFETSPVAMAEQWLSNGLSNGLTSVPESGTSEAPGSLSSPPRGR